MIKIDDSGVNSTPNILVCCWIVATGSIATTFADSLPQVRIRDGYEGRVFRK
ncbi:MAG: hypothetical protein IPM91_16020 [Bacteroidetes bacterium]|nr:hypothetical protein [Bacteroidota bacterium]